MKSGWATPFVWENGKRTEIVTIGRGFVISYDTDGSELWRLKGMTQATPSPVAADGLLYVGSGSQGEANRPLMRDPAGRDRRHLADRRPGDATTSSPGGSRASRATRRRRSSIAAASTRSTTTASCRWPTRRPARKSTRRAWAAAATRSRARRSRVRGGSICSSEDGDTFVLRAGDKYDEMAKNSLGEMSLATPAADADSLYVRTQTKLYRIKGAKTK